MFRRLLIATVVGILAAFAVAGFRHAMLLLEWLFLNNDSGSLVNAATNLSPRRRLLTPALGGLAAGLLLMGWQKFTQQRPHAPTDYMEALQTDGQFDYAASWLNPCLSAGSNQRQCNWSRRCDDSFSCPCRLLFCPTFYATP